jgi:circadian clock protein KaiC
LNGYLNSVPGEQFLAVQLHELLSSLSQVGVVTIMTMAQHGLLSERLASPVDVSYIADAVVLLRYFETSGAVRKAISVIKSRLGPHEATIRELKIGPVGMRVGPPLERFHGVLTGTPIFETQTQHSADAHARE